MEYVSPLGIRYEDERVAIFIDGPNFYSAGKNANIDVDYKRLKELLELDSKFLRAYYYTPVAESEEDGFNKIQPLLDFLDFNGYSVITKPIKEFHNENGQRRQQGGMTVEIAVDMLSVVDRVDHVILFSGDSDFRRLIEAVQAKGVRVTVISHKNVVATEIRRQADNYIDLESSESLRKAIDRPRSTDDRRAAAR